MARPIPVIIDGLDASEVRARRASRQMSDVANLPAGSYIETDNGDVPSVAEWYAEREEDIGNVGVLAAEAKDSANLATRAADAATVNSKVYPDLETGRLATADGDYFLVLGFNADEASRLYLRVNSGTTSLQKIYPSLAATAGKAPISSPAFLGTPTAPNANLSYENSSQIATLNAVNALTRNHRSIAVTAPLMTLTVEQARFPVVSFTGALNADTIIEIPVDGAGLTRIFRVATTSDYSLTVRHVAQTGGVVLRRGEVASTISNGPSVIRVGVSVEQIAAINAAIAALEDANIEFDGMDQLRYVGVYSATQQYKKGESVKYNDSYFYADSLTETQVNYALNPLFNSNGSGWQTAGTSTIKRGDGVFHYRLVADKASGGLLLSNTGNQESTTAGELWSAAIVVTNYSAVNFSVRLGLFFSGSTTAYAGPTVILAGQSVRVLHQGIPATAGSTGVRITISNAVGDAIPSGTEISFSEPVLSKGAVAIGYFDGSFASSDDISYAWLGDPLSSHSLKIEKVEQSTIGVPGDDPKWIKYLADIPAGGGGSVAPIGVFTPTITEKPGQEIMCVMTLDRTIGFNWGSSNLNMTYDDGETWELLRAFPGMQTTFVRELENGELLVGVNNSNLPAEAWLSSGFRKGGDVTWSKVLTAHSTYTNFASAWGVFDDGNMVLLIDYGGKAGVNYGSTPVVPDGENARYAYMSLDFGKTWKTIFDLNEWALSNGYATMDDQGQPQARGFHCHGIAYDKWWDRIWITFGDNTALAGMNSCGGTCYSDDFGKTWRAANWGKDSQHLSPTGSRHQNVGIWPMQDCILFGTDSSPNGVHRIERSQGKNIVGEYVINIAYAYSDEPMLTHLCQGIYQAINIPNQPVFFAFGAEGAIRKSFIVATRDGFDFKLVWESAEPNARGMGLRLIAGPTRQGNLVSRITDNIDGVVTNFQVIGPAPIYETK